MGTIKAVNGESCTVEVDGGGIVEAKAVNIGGVGDRTTLSLRPERVEVTPEGGKLPNMFEAKVEELIYLGDHIRTRVNVCGHDDFIVKIPNASHHASLVEGETVTFGWSIEDCRALDA
jgi:putative spermidine/putrescine transport system ATP-binding protein